MTRLAILGGGQLARMMALSAHSLGVQTFCIDPAPNCCAADVADVRAFEYEDTETILEYLQSMDRVTFETENISPVLLEALSGNEHVFPSPQVISIFQDRLTEKNCLQDAGIPTTAYTAVSTLEDACSAVSTLGFPCVLKTRRGGYDGKGQAVIHSLAELERVWPEFTDMSLLLEQWCPFDYECSLVAVRSQNKEVRYYPLTLNTHRDGILRLSQAPFADMVMQQKAQAYANAILEQCNYVGVMTLEFFVLGKELIANEIAPRVHNSGHWTIEGAQTSQFENHVRAVFGWPLGSTQSRGQSIMINILGEPPNAWQELLAIEGLHPHLYGKSNRPKRKIGHVTLHATDKRSLENGYARLSEVFPLPGNRGKSVEL